MQKKRLLPSFVIGLLVVSTAPAAFALGWRPAPQTAVLGQALDFTAALRLDPGDTIDAECVHASVDVGDHRLPRPLVELTVDKRSDALVMHVATREPISEPVASVTLAIGCPTRLSRRFVLLADPPGVALPSVPLVLAAAPAPAPTPAVVAPPRPARAVQAPAVAAPAATRPTPAPHPPQHRAPARERPPVAPKPSKAVAAAAAEPVRSRPRLELDPVDRPAQSTGAPGDVLDAAIDAVAQATSAARAAAAAASASEQRIEALERNLARMQAEAAANRELLAALRSRAAAGDATSRWLTPLLLALAALVGLVGWLVWRMRALQQERDRAWHRAAAAAAADAGPPAPATRPIPVVQSELMPEPPVRTARAAAPSDLPLEYERTDVLPAPVRVASGAPRDVSIEELLDLEQQAEFFIVLGQDDAAIDLLLQHLRNTGGGSPLPYLKLLEIYRRRGEREAYERTRERFNERFNAYAPEWDVDLQHGRSLEDYPGVLPRLQQVWPRPLDAMAELEALMFRKSRGELFDLPAYREVLFLYSLARDLLDREAAGSGDVDLLLPLSDAGEFGSTAPQPHLELERDSAFAPVFGGGADRATAPVDLDLSLPDEPAAPRS